MVPPHKVGNALAALNAILVVVRKFAHDERPYQLIANTLDAAEYLPRLLSDEEDRVTAFRDTLVELVALDPALNFALERFDRENLGRW